MGKHKKRALEQKVQIVKEMNYLGASPQSFTERLPLYESEVSFLYVLLKKFQLSTIHLSIFFSLISNVIFDLFLISIFSYCTYEISSGP